MKRENLEKAKNAIEQAQKIEYVLDRINHPDPDYSDKDWDWIPKNVNYDCVRQILLNLTGHEEICLKELKGAMTIILKQAAERTLKDINAEIAGM